MDKIDVFLLAAGESSRMFPLSQIMEKSLLPVDGKPVIRHIVDNIKFVWDSIHDIHIGKIIICCLSKFKKQFGHEFRDCLEWPIEIIDFPKPIGTYNTFHQATEIRKENTTKHVMVHYADCMTDINYGDLIYNYFMRNRGKWDGMIAVTKNVKHDYSEIILQSDVVEDTELITPTVHAFYEKPKLSNWTWSGIGIFNLENLKGLYHHKNENTDFAQDIFPQMIERESLTAYPYPGYWYDMGNLNSYRKVCSMLNGEK